MFQVFRKIIVCKPRNVYVYQKCVFMLQVLLKKRLILIKASEPLYRSGYSLDLFKLIHCDYYAHLLSVCILSCFSFLFFCPRWLIRSCCVTFIVASAESCSSRWWFRLGWNQPAGTTDYINHITHRVTNIITSHTRTLHRPNVAARSFHQKAGEDTWIIVSYWISINELKNRCWSCICQKF